MTTTQTCHFHETLRLCSETHHLFCMTYHFYANPKRIAAQSATFSSHKKSRFGALPNGRAIGAGFEHLRSLAVTKTTTGEHSSTLPQVKREPFATHSGIISPLPAARLCFAFCFGCRAPLWLLASAGDWETQKSLLDLFRWIFSLHFSPNFIQSLCYNLQMAFLASPFFFAPGHESKLSLSSSNGSSHLVRKLATLEGMGYQKASAVRLRKHIQDYGSQQTGI